MLLNKTSFLCKTVGTHGSEFMVYTFEGGEYAPDELYSGFIDRTPLEAGVHLLFSSTLNNLVCSHM